MHSILRVDKWAVPALSVRKTKLEIPLPSFLEAGRLRCSPREKQKTPKICLLRFLSDAEAARENDFCLILCLIF